MVALGIYSTKNNKGIYGWRFNLLIMLKQGTDGNLLALKDQRNYGGKFIPY